MSLFNFFGEDDKKTSSVFNFFDDPLASPLDPKPEEIFEGGKILVRKGAFYVDKDTGAIVRPVGSPGALAQDSPEIEAATKMSPLEKAAIGVEDVRESVSEGLRSGLHSGAASAVGTLQGLVQNKPAIPFMPKNAPNPFVMVGEALTGTRGLQPEIGPVSEDESRAEATAALADKFKEERARAAELMGPDPSFWKKLVSQVPQAAGQMATYAVGGPAASAAFMGSQIFGSEYGEDVAAGTDPAKAFVGDAALAAANSYLEGLLPARAFASLKAQGPLLEKAKGYLGTALLEGSTEYIENYATHFKNLLFGKYGNPMSDKFDKERWERDTDLLAKPQLEAFAMGTILGPMQEFAARGIAGAAGSLARSRADLNTAISADDPVAANAALDEMQKRTQEYNDALARGEIDPDTHAETISAFKDDSKLNPILLQKFHLQYATKLADKNEPLDPESGFPQSIIAAASSGSEQGLKNLARVAPLYGGVIPNQAAIATQTEKGLNDQFTALVIDGKKQEAERQQWISEQAAERPQSIAEALDAKDPNEVETRLRQIYPHDNRVYKDGLALPINRIITKEGQVLEGNRGTESMMRPVLNELLKDYNSYDDSQLSALHALLSGPEGAAKNSPQIERLLNSRGLTIGPDLGEVVSLAEGLSRAGTPLSIYTQVKRSGRTAVDAYHASILFDSLVGGVSSDGKYDGVIDFVDSSGNELTLGGEGNVSAYVTNPYTSGLSGIRIGPAFNERADAERPSGVSEVHTRKLIRDQSVLIHEFAHVADNTGIQRLVGSKSAAVIEGFMLSGSEYNNNPGERLAIGVQYALAYMSDNFEMQDKMIVDHGFSHQTVDAMVNFGRSFSKVLERENREGGPGAAEAIRVSGVRYGDVRRDMNPKVAEALLSLFAGKPHNAKMIAAYHDYSEMKDLEARVIGRMAVNEEARQNPGEDPEIAVFMKGLDRALKPGSAVHQLAMQAAQSLVGQGQPLGLDMGDPTGISRFAEDTPDDDLNEAITLGEIEREQWKTHGLKDKPAPTASQSPGARFARWLKGYTGLGYTPGKSLSGWFSGGDKTGAAQMLSVSRGGELVLPTNTQMAGRSFLPGAAQDLFVNKIGPMVERGGGDVQATVARFDLLSHDYLDALAAAAKTNKWSPEQIANAKAMTTLARESGDLSIIEDEGIRLAASNLYGSLDDLTRQMISSGLFTKSQVEKMTQNLGVYIHGDYAAFHARDYFDIAASDKKRLDAAMSIMVDEYIARGDDATAAHEHALGELRRMVRDRLDPSNLSPQRTSGNAKILSRMDKTEMLSRLGKHGVEFYSFRDQALAAKEKSRQLGEDVSGVDVSYRALLLNWAKGKIAEIDSQYKGYPEQLVAPYRRIQFAAENMFSIPEYEKLTEAQATSRIIRDEDMPPAIRDFMGEIRDPTLSVRLGVAHMAHDLVYGRMWAEIRDAGIASGAFIRGGAQQQHTAKIEEQSLGPLTQGGKEDLYTTQDVRNLLSAIFATRQYSTLATMISSLKLFKILAPSTWARNVESGVPMMLLNGDLTWNLGEAEQETEGGESVVGLRARRARQAAALTVAQRGSGKVARWATRGLRNESEAKFWVTEGMKRGVLDPGINKELLIDIEDIKGKRGKFDSQVSKQGKVETAAKLYNTPDVFNKTLAFQTRAEQLAWYYSPDLRSMAPISEKILDEAANSVNNTYQTYSRLPQIIRDFNRVNGSFATFSAEMVRNLVNSSIETAQWGAESVRMGAKGDFVHATKAGVIFANRAAGLIAASIMLKALLDYNNKERHGVDKATSAAIARLVGGRGSENSTPMILSRKDNEITYVDWTNQDPYVFVQKLINILFNNDGATLADKGIAVAREAQRTFLPPGIPYKAALELISGQDVENDWSLGRKYETAGTKMEFVPIPFGPKIDIPITSTNQARLYRLYRNIGPTAITDTGEGFSRAGGLLESEMGSRKYTMLDQAMRTIGIAVQRKNIVAPFWTRTSEFQGWKETFDKRTNVDLKKIPEDDLTTRRQVFLKAEKEWRSKWAGYHRTIMDARAAGISDDEIETIIRNMRTGLSKDAINNLLDDIYTPYEDVFNEWERD